MLLQQYHWEENSVSPYQLNKKLIADLEDISEKIPENKRDVPRNRGTSIITNHLHKNHNTTFKSEKMYKETRKFLR